MSRLRTPAPNFLVNRTNTIDVINNQYGAIRRDYATHPKKFILLMKQAKEAMLSQPNKLKKQLMTLAMAICCIMHQMIE